MEQLLTPDELPHSFRYPKEFLWIVGRNLVKLGPWFIPVGEQLRGTHHWLRDRYPARTWIPFARRLDCDEIACWDADKPRRVIVVDAELPSGFETDPDLKSFRREYDDFWAWFRHAVEDMIEFAMDDIAEGKETGSG